MRSTLEQPVTGAATRWMWRTISSWAPTLLLALALEAPARADTPAPPCRRELDRVVCEAGAFDVLTKRCVDFRTSAERCDVNLGLSDARSRDLDQALRACEAARAVPPPEPPPSRLPIVTYALGSTGALAVATALAFQGASDTVRITVGVVGIGSLAAGLILAAR